MAGQSFADISILVVEDGTFSRNVLSRVLDVLGPGRVKHALNGEQALGLLAEADAPFDIVITDVMMPGMDGFDLVERIRWGEAPGHEAVPVIVLTGKEPVKNAERARKFDIAAFLVKPPRPEELRAAIEQALDL